MAMLATPTTASEIIFHSGTGDAVGSSPNPLLLSRAKAALEAAQLAAADATVAKARVDAMSADGILDRSEKASVIREFAEEAAQQTGLISQVTNVDVAYDGWSTAIPL